MRVKLIQAHGDGLLVEGIDDDDEIVVRGAGVLWSLQGIIGTCRATTTMIESRAVAVALSLRAAR
jgi:hypothetical protein